MESKFKLVDRFSRPGLFVTKRGRVRFLDLLKPGECEEVDGFFDATGYDSELAPSPDGWFVYMASDTTIWQLEVGARQIREIAQLDELPNWPEGGAAHWVNRISDDGAFLYFMVGPDPSRTKRQNLQIARMRLATRELEVIDFPWPTYSVDIDFQTGQVYGSDRGRPSLIMRSFDGEAKDLGFYRGFLSVRLSPRRDRLLISSHGTDEDLSIHVFDLSRGKAARMPFRGSNANWSGEDSVLVLRGDQELWKCSLDGTEERLFYEATDGSYLTTGTHSHEAIFSNDKTWLAWTWVTSDKGQARWGTVIADLLNHEYRALPFYGCHLAIASPDHVRGKLYDVAAAYPTVRRTRNTEDKPSPDLPEEGLIFVNETRWHRMYRDSHDCMRIKSKFRTGEASISLDALVSEWPKWTDDVRGDFIRSFYSDDRSHSLEVFRFLISLAKPDDRARYHEVFGIEGIEDEALNVLSDWMMDPATIHRPVLFISVIMLAKAAVKPKAIALLKRVLDQDMANGRFWRDVERHAVSPEQVREVISCLSTLGWLGEGAEAIPLLERIASSGLSWSGEARHQAESGKLGRWSL